MDFIEALISGSLSLEDFLEGKIPGPSTTTWKFMPGSIPAYSATTYHSNIRGGKRNDLTQDQRDDDHISKAIRHPDKDRDSRESAETAVSRMLRFVDANTDLIPLPNRKGNTEANLLLAQQLAAQSGAKVVDVIRRYREAPSSREWKLKYGTPMPINAHEMIPITDTKALAARGVNDEHLNYNPGHERRVLFVDNVSSSGSSIAAARHALGNRGHGVVYASPEDKRKYKSIPFETFTRPDKLTATDYSTAPEHKGFYGIDGSIHYNDGTKVYYSDDEENGVRRHHVFHEGERLGYFDIAHNKKERNNKKLNKEFAAHHKMAQSILDRDISDRRGLRGQALPQTIERSFLSDSIIDEYDAMKHDEESSLGLARKREITPVSGVSAENAELGHVIDHPVLGRGVVRSNHRGSSTRNLIVRFDNADSTGRRTKRMLVTPGIKVVGHTDHVLTNDHGQVAAHSRDIHSL